MDDERTLSHENESAAEDVDPEPKKYVTESTSRQESALDEKRDDDYPEADGESSTSQEECFMEQLPVEILRMIFSYLGSWELYNPRLVSKTWCNILSQDQTLCFNTTVPPHAHLEKCGFKRMSLDFGDIDLSEFPLSIWKKIGCEIHSLTLHGCKIGDQCLKNIIVHCCNLKFLWVNFDNDDSADSFCSPDMLRELHITRKNLETFQIFNIHRRTIDITEWIQKFEDFLKVFPNVTYFRSGLYVHSTFEDTMEIRFSKKHDDEDDASGIATTLAYSLSANESHQRLAFEAFSTLRLIDDVSVRFVKEYYNDEDEVTLIKFFSNHRELKCVEIILGESISSNTLKTLLFKILEHCPNLCKLHVYCWSSFSDTLHTLSKREFVQFCTMCSHLEELFFNNFKFLINYSSLSCWDYCKLSSDWLSSINRFNSRLQDFVTTYLDLQHLDIGLFPSCTDDTLQRIFKHLINLKTLSLCLSYWNTNLGITGRPGDAPGVCKIRTAYYHLNEGRSLFSNSSNTISGYSINRLKNLEKLTITGFINSMMNDTIFHEFNFPKLRFLKIEPPDVPKEILNLTMGQNMPALEKIHFTRINYYSDFIRNKELYYENFEGSLASFCQPMKKLHGIIHPGTLTTESGTLKSETIDVFQACQSLRFIEGGDGSSAYRDPYNYERIKYSQKN